MKDQVVTQAQMNTLADELEASVVAKGQTLEGAQAAPGGIFPQVATLIAALRAGDWTGFTTAIRDMLNVALG